MTRKLDASICTALVEIHYGGATSKLEDYASMFVSFCMNQRMLLSVDVHDAELVGAEVEERKHVADGECGKRDAEDGMWVFSLAKTGRSFQSLQCDSGRLFLVSLSCAMASPTIPLSSSHLSPALPCLARRLRDNATRRARRKRCPPLRWRRR